MRPFAGSWRVGMLRSIGAMTAGLLATVALALAADGIFRLCAPQAFAEDSEPAWLVLLVALTYIGVAAAAGSYLAARIARNHIMLHSLSTGGAAFIVALFATAMVWTAAPAWYHVTASLLILPAASLGGILVERQRRVAL
jgi:hypothetical protein